MRMLTLKSHDYFIRPENTIAIEKRDTQENYLLHNHDFYEVVIVLSGNGIHVCNGESLLVTGGDIFYINAHDQHGYQSVDNLRLINILYKPEQFLLRDSLSNYIPINSVEKSLSHWKVSDTHLSQIMLLIYQLDNECRKPDLASIDLCEALFMQLTIILYRVRYQPDSAVISDPHQIDLLLNALHNSIAGPFSLEQFAQQQQVSVRSLYRLFKARTGMTMVGYLQKLRLCEAANLLRNSSLSISDVAALIGYEDSNYFSALFHRKMQVTASEYRRRFRVKQR